MNSEIQQLIKDIHAAMTTSNRRLAVAESLTGGRIQSLITSVSGASEYFEGGITTYTIDQKVAHLGVDRELANRCNAVDEIVAQQMARGVCELFDCKVSVATTGYAQPDVANSVATPFAFISVFDRENPNGHNTQRIEWQGDVQSSDVRPGSIRNAAQQFFAEQSIQMLHAACNR